MSHGPTNRSSLNAWIARNVLATIDQGVFAGGNFVLNVLLARWLGAETYGAFAIGFTGFLLLAGFHNALILEPATVLGPGRHFDAIRSYFQKQTALHCVVTLLLGAGMALLGLILFLFDTQRTLGLGLVGAGIALPFMLLFWLSRRLLYVLGRPFDALLGSSAYLVLTLSGAAALLHLSVLSPFLAFIVMAAASLISSLGMFWRASLLGHVGEKTLPSPLAEVFRENWGYGRWLLGGTILYSLANQSQIFLCAGILGVEAAGVLRALQLPSLVMVQISTAIGTMALPEIARTFGQGDTAAAHHQGHRVTGILLSLALVIAAFLAWKYPLVESLLFAGQYRENAWLIPVLALIPVFNAACAGASLILRAARRPEFELRSNFWAALVGIGLILPLLKLLGVAGAALAMVFASLAAAAVTLCLQIAWCPEKDDSGLPGRSRTSRVAMPVEALDSRPREN